MASKRFRDAIGIDPDRIVAAAVDAAMGETRSRGKRHHPGRVLAAGAAVAAAAAVGQRRMPRMAKAPLRMGLHKLGDMAHVDELADALRDRLAGHQDEPDDDYYDEEELDDEDYDDEDYDEEESDEEESDDDEEFDDEPRDEADDEADDEDDEGFDDEDDEGFDDEPEDDDGPRGEGDEEEPEDDSDEAGPEDDEPEDLEAEEDDEDLEPEEDDEDLEPEEDDEDLESDEDDEQIAARSLDLGVSSDAREGRARDRVPDLFAALRTPHRRPPVMRRGSLRVDPATRPPEPGESHARDERRNRSRKSKSTAARA
jgi:hypothetical protein